MRRAYSFRAAVKAFFHLVILGVVAHALVFHSRAQVVNLIDKTSIASIDLNNPNPALVGMFQWSVQGQNELRQQWFWFRVDGNPEVPLNALGLVGVTPFLGTRGLSTVYGAGPLNVQIDYLLTGSSAVPINGLAQSDIQETITLHNSGTNAIPLSFFQYSDFDLAGAGNDTITLGKDPGGLYNSANQSDGVSTLTESVSVTAPSASHGEAALFNATWLKLNDGNPDVLNDNATAGPGNVTWALEWDMLLLPSQDFIISKDKHLQVQIIPEPSLFALLGIGLASFVLRRQRK